MKKVSIVVLTYNNIDLLYNALRSISIQKYENIEILISDDCSKDVSYNQINKVIEETLPNSDVSIYINETNLGTVKNFNNAIKRATGDFIFPLSCDDRFIDCDVVGDIVDFLEGNDLLICTSMRKGENTGINLPLEEDISILKANDSDMLIARLSINNIISGATLYYDKRVFDKFGMFDEKYDLLEDYPYVFALAKRGVSIGWLDRVTVMYGEKGVSSSNNGATINPRLQIDADVMLFDDVFPSAMSIKDRRVRRYLEYRVKKIQGKIPVLLLWLRYLDLSYLKIKKILKRDNRNIFWVLYKSSKRKEKLCK